MKDYKDEDFLQLSGIQHYKFCKRQWALIHIEMQWEDNLRTTLGNIIHEKAHDSSIKEKRKNVIISRAMPIKSHILGISGECDVVEFVKDDLGVFIPKLSDKYILYPIEYKKGKPKDDDFDVLQLVAQAMCLEEMFQIEIDKAYLFYHEIRRRIEVEITQKLKTEVQSLFLEMHDIYERKYTPKVRIKKHCNACSLKDICLPVLSKETSVKGYIDKFVEEQV